ncbi:S-M checkpoint control protein rad4 [Escovopsis weberi]|uniref:S-M checkpoint control protein rad4 n=1 Tax=Escovopsis weberi TaxID=150374 RepID=A0A0M8N6L7_ESCWE|nr:S-M checkpoint control protein rad4 [Escovopsis weberi]
MASPTPAEHHHLDIDPSEPFKRIVVCCTSIPHEQRTELANKVAELGGVHKYDLTPDVTHLVVGDYNTPKYRHVARERPDVKAMDAHWVHAVAELWKNDDHFDFGALESTHQLRPLETCGIEAASQEDGSSAARGSLLICLTGFGDQREDIAEKIKNAGGRHTGDLTKSCTHLIAHKPEGKKFTAAKLWGVHTVTLEWLSNSLERGMILEEDKFDPLLPVEEQGVGAWTRNNSPSQTTLGKRSRSAAAGDNSSGIANGAAPEEGTRKLRKTASKKLSSQSSHIWGDILGRPGSAEQAAPKDDQPAAQASAGQPTQPLVQRDKGVFFDCTFVVHGFSQQRAAILEQTISTMGGSIAPSLSHPSITPESKHPQFLIVPQSSQPDTHPQIPHDKMDIMTEFYVENCLHYKRFFAPDEHILGRPFPLFPIPSFADLTICSAAFTGIELNHVSRSVAQLGAKYEEAFRKTASVLVCKSLGSVRKEKLKLALDWGVPIVPGDWLWQCISTGFLAPIEDHVYPELKKRYSQHASSGAQSPKSQTAPAPPKANILSNGSSSNSRSSSSASKRPPTAAGVDTTAFERDPTPGSSRTSASTNGALLRGRDPVTADDFASAPSRSSASSNHHHPPTSRPSFLAEASSSTLNKSLSAAPAPKPAAPRLPLRSLRDPFANSDSDSDFDRDRDRDRTPQPPEPRKDRAASAPEALAAAAAAAKADEDRKLRQGLTTALSGLVPAPDPASADPDAAGRPRRRRHKVMGRAVSNVSIESSAASLEACSFRGDLRQHEDEDEAPPPATQLGYEDAEARGHKAALMSKMAAGGGGGREGEEC